MPPAPDAMIVPRENMVKGFENGQTKEMDGSENEQPEYDESIELLTIIADTKLGMDLFLSNKFLEAEEKMAVLADKSMYHALGHGSLLFIKAMMTCDRADMERAMEAARSGSVVIDKFRARYSIADSIYRIGGTLKSLTDEQIHAELCYAELLMARAILTFFYDESLTSFIKGAFKIRSCYQSFKECYRVLNTSTSWLNSPDEARNSEVRRQFECGVRMGIGAFNLMLSALPTKLLRLLEVVGFSGNKNVHLLLIILPEAVEEAADPCEGRPCTVPFRLLGDFLRWLPSRFLCHPIYLLPSSRAANHVKRLLDEIRWSIRWSTCWSSSSMQTPLSKFANIRANNLTVGMMELHMASSMTDTMRSPLVCMVLLAWYLVVTYLVGAGCQKNDLSMCRQLLTPLVETYPNGAIVLFLRARFFLVSGDLDTAIFFYNKSIEAQNVYHQFHHICYWELLFAYSYMRRWDRAANHAKRLLDESRWSRCVYTYMLAILINADTTVPVNKRNETVKMLLTKIPSIRLRIAGKSIPVEKFAEKKTVRYLRRGSLYYPHYEFMYFWNGFSILDGHPNFVRPILDDIEAIWRSSASDDPDDESLYLFLRGVCHRSLKENYKAEDCFLRVMEK